MSNFERLIQTIEMMYGSKPVIANDHKPRMVVAKDGTWVPKAEVLAAVRKEAANAR